MSEARLVRSRRLLKRRGNVCERRDQGAEKSMNRDLASHTGMSSRVHGKCK